MRLSGLERMYAGLLRDVVVPSGTTALTLLETDILRRKFAGATTKEVAFALNIGVQGTKNHLSQIYRKLGVQGLWGAFTAAGFMVTEAGEQARIAALRAEARAMFQAIADSLAP